MAATVALQLQTIDRPRDLPARPWRNWSEADADRRRSPIGAGLRRRRRARLDDDQSGVMVTFQPPDLKFVPLAEAINKVRTVPADSVFVQIARSLGISLGD